MFCANCGARMDDGSTFCGDCVNTVDLEEQTTSVAPFRAVLAEPYSPELLEPSRLTSPAIESEKPKPPRKMIVIGALVIVIAIGGIFACKTRNDGTSTDRKLEEAAKTIAAEEEAAKARTEKQVEEAQKVIIAVEALAAAKQDGIEAEQARVAAEQERIAKQAEEDRLTKKEERVKETLARPAMEVKMATEKQIMEQSRATAEKAKQREEQLRRIQEKRNDASVLFVPPTQVTSIATTVRGADTPANLLTAVATVTAPPPKPKQAPVRIDVDVMSGNLIRQVNPTYPNMARRARVSGVVVLEVQVDEDGNVEAIEIKSGPALLRQAAQDAIKQWKYAPTLLNGEPVPVSGEVRVPFNLN